VRFEPSQFTSARWVHGPEAEIDRLVERNKPHIAHDNDGDVVFLTRLQWDIDRVERDFPELRLAPLKQMA
jgi:peptide chain release factor 3